MKLFYKKVYVSCVDFGRMLVGYNSIELWELAVVSYVYRRCCNEDFGSFTTPFCCDEFCCLSDRRYCSYYSSYKFVN